MAKPFQSGRRLHFKVSVHRTRRIVAIARWRRDARASFQSAAERSQLAHEILLIGLVPRHRVSRTHGRVTVGPKLTLAGSRSIGLSAPSICSRIKYCPAGTAGIAMVREVPPADRGTSLTIADRKSTRLNSSHRT